ncbi:putative NADH dehydrogenase/NAD(P)H nitroreductase [Geobacter sp. OR-1]|uniref:nitroreductase family protein n=1 Tax=Geobacter sp. OR-1 TaxID=1266765 RepID=UPI000542C9B9|nr:nitroreductase family protein [Geobacter sp. OR-1]GAM10902.1 putative NADH dehydrogenase/NAD(P)H nitroreductase [Geobacter sp. OR-1]
MNLVTIDHTTCRRDGACIAVCPMGLFDTDSAGFPAFRPGAAERCIGCGHCVAVCPRSALHHTALPLEESPLIDHGLAVSVPALEQLIRSRRSVREFKEEPVPEALVQQAIEAARWAPSAVNRQPVHWLVIRTPAEVRRLAGLVIDYLRRISAQEPRYAPFIDLWEQGKDPILRNAPHLVVIHAPDDWIWSSVDSTIALTQFELAAAANGIGTCWAGFLMRAANGYPPLRDALDIPGSHSVFGAMMFGLPRYRYHRIPPRQAALITWR